MKTFSAWGVALLCVVTCGTVAKVSAWLDVPRVRVEDQNGDGRPDAWYQYDDRGQIAEVAIDSNFDGRSDIHEYFERGTLVRRESDRNFDDRIDIVEEFDPATHEQTRAVVDVDYDGTADLLVLFQNGRPVFWKHAARARGTSSKARREIAARGSRKARGNGASRLAPLTDPFRGDLAVRRTRSTAASPDDCVGLSTSGGLPGSGAEAVSPLTPSTPLLSGDVRPSPHRSSFPRSPRGPPSA